VVFGPRPRSYAKKVNDRTRKLSLRKALTERLKAGDVIIVDDIKLSSAKTKDFVTVMSALGIKGSTLIVASGANDNLQRASRNIEKVSMTTGDILNTYDVLRPNHLLFTRSAFEMVEARLNKE
jgi:large subunit ribosomal protein L4